MASLGAVTIASGEALTVSADGLFSTLTAGDTTAKLNVDATEGNVTLTNSASLIKSFEGLTTFLGGSTTVDETTTSTGATVDFGIANSSTLSGRLAFSGGTHTLTYGAGNQTVLFGPAGGDDTPVLDILEGTTLNFALKDLSGWTSDANAGTRVVRVRKGATLNTTQTTAYNDSGVLTAQTAYFNNRLILDDGATVNIGSNDGTFRLNGGVRTEATAQIAMLGGTDATSATIKGNAITLPANVTQGVGIAVSDNATLTISNAINSIDSPTGAIAKYGSGKLILSGANTYVNPMTVSAGTVSLTGADTSCTGAVTVEANATLDFASTGAVTLSGAITNEGTITQSGTGATTLSGEVSEDGAITVAAGTLNIPTLTYANVKVTGGTLNGIIMGTVTVPSGSTANLVGTMPTVVNEGTITVADGQTLTMTAGDEGTVTVAAGGILNLVLPADEYVYGYSNTSITNNGKVYLFAPGTTDFSDAANTAFKTYTETPVTYTSTMKVWTVATGETSGSWTEVARWTDSNRQTLTELPASTDDTAIYLSGTSDITVSVPTNSEVASVTVVRAEGATANLIFTNTDSAKLTVSGAFTVASSMTITDAPPVLACTSLNVDRGVDLIFTPGDTSQIPEGTEMPCPTTKFTGLGTLRLQGIPNGTATSLDIAPTLTFYLVNTKLGLTATGTSAKIGIDKDSTLYETVPSALSGVTFAGVTTTSTDTETGDTVETTTYGTVGIAFSDTTQSATSTTLTVDHFETFNGTLEISGGCYAAGSTPLNENLKIVVSGAGQLYLTGGTWPNKITISGTGWTNTEDTNKAAALRMVEGTTLSGAVTVTDGASIAVEVSSTSSDAGTIASTATLTAANGFKKIGDGILTLAGQTYDAVAGTVTVSAGTLDWDAETKASAGATHKLGDTLVMNSGTTLNLHVSTDTIANDTASAMSQIATAITLNSATLTTEDGSYCYSKDFTVTGSSSYTMFYRKSAIFSSLKGDSTATLTATVTSKTDGTTAARINFIGGDFNGKLICVGDTTTSPVVDTWLGVGDANVLADATIEFTGVKTYLRLLADATVGSLTMTATGTSGGVFTDGTGAKTLTLNGGQINYALKDISSGESTSSPLSLIVAGNVTLNAVNTLSGNVTVSSGSLTLTAANTLTGKVTVEGGTLKLDAGAGNNALSAATVAIGSSGALNLASGTLTVLTDNIATDSTATITVAEDAVMTVYLDLGECMDGYTLKNTTLAAVTTGTSAGVVKFVDLYGNAFTDGASTVADSEAQTVTLTPGVATWKASTQTWDNDDAGPTINDEGYTNTTIVINFDDTVAADNDFTFGTSTTTKYLNVDRAVSMKVQGSGTVNITSALRVGRVNYDQTDLTQADAVASTVVMNNSAEVTFLAGVNGNAALTYVGSANVTVANRALTNSNYSGVLTLSGTGEFHLGNVTAEGQSSYTLTNGSKTGVGSHVVINKGNILYIHAWEDNQDDANGGYTHSQTADDLVSFVTPVTLNGGTLYSADGAYYFTNTVTVNNGTDTDGSAVTSTIRQNWGKTLAFEKITGAGDLTWDNTNGDPTTDTKYNAWSVVKSTDGFTGAVTFTRSGQGRRLVIPAEGCFATNKVSFSDSGNLTKLVLEGNRTIGMIDGSGVTVVSGTMGTDGAVTESKGNVLTVAGVSGVSGNFAGTINDSVPLTLGDSSPALTISGTLGNNTYTQPVTLTTGTLTLAPSAATTLSGAITNNAALVLGGTTETTISGSISGTGSVGVTGSATLTGGNTYTGGTTVDGTLTINGSSADTMVLPESPVVGEVRPTAPTTVTVNSDATLKLVQGLSYTTITGDGTTQVTNNGTYTFGVSGDYTNALGTATVVIDSGATLQFRDWRTSAYAFTPTSLTVNGTLKNEGAYSAAKSSTLTIPSGGTLTGLGTISMATKLDDGSTLKLDTPTTATNGNLSVSSLSYGTNESVTFAFGSAISADTNLYTHVLRMETETDVAPIPSSPTFKEADSTVYNIKLISSAPNLSAYKCVIPDMTSYTTESVRKITNVGYGKSLSSVSGTTLTGSSSPKTLAIDDFNNAFALFDNVVKVETDSAGANNAIITYDFGISGVTVVTENDTQYAILTVEVSNSATNNTAAFSSGTTVAVYNGTTKLDATEVADTAGATGSSTTAGVKYLKVPLSATTGTTALTVKAVSSTTASN